MISFGTRKIYCWSLECTEKKELCLAQIHVWSGWGSLVVELVLASTPGTGNTWSANPVNAENLSFTVSLSLGLPLFTASFSYLSVQYSCFGTSVFSTKSWNPYLLHLVAIKDALKFSDVLWLWFPVSRHFLFFLQTWNTFCTRAAKAVQFKIK